MTIRQLHGFMNENRALSAHSPQGKPLFYALLLLLSMLVALPAGAQDNTPQPAFVEGAFKAVQNAVGRSDAPVNWSFQQATAATDSGLSCPTAVNPTPLSAEVVPWRVVVEFADGASYIVHTSTDGTLANLCDASFGDWAGQAVDVSPTGCVATLIAPTALKRAPLDIAATLGDLPAEQQAAVLGTTQDNTWLHLAINGQKGWVTLASVTTANSVDSAEDFCTDLPQTGISSPTYDPAIACYVSPLTAYANVRAVPVVDGDLVTQIYENSTYEVRGTNSIGDWVLIDVGWVFGAVTVQSGACAGVLTLPDDAYLVQAGATVAPETLATLPAPTAIPITAEPAQPTSAPLSNTDAPSIALTNAVSDLLIANDGKIYFASAQIVSRADFVGQTGDIFINADAPITAIEMVTGAVMMVALADGTLQLWDTASEAPDLLQTLPDAFDPIYNRSVAFSPDLSFYLSAGCQSPAEATPETCIQGAINLHDANSARILRVQPAHPTVPQALSFINEGTQIASLGYDGIQIWDTVSGAFVTGITSPINELTGFLGGYVLSAGDVIWAYRLPEATRIALQRANVAEGDVVDDAPLWEIDAGEADAVAFAISADEARLVLGRDTGLVTVLDVTTGESLITTQIPAPLVHVALSADGRLMIASNATTLFAIQVP